MEVAIIAVLDELNGIGKNNRLLCHLPADLKRFKQLTTGHSVLMGRETFESLPNGPLPNRQNIILTRNTNFKADSCSIVHSVKEVFEICSAKEKVFIIGGGQIYNLFIQHADIMYITKIHHIFEADTFFPSINPNDWQIGSKIDRLADEKNKFDYSFIDYVRKK